jgi:hypothetical protein
VSRRFAEVAAAAFSVGAIAGCGGGGSSAHRSTSPASGPPHSASTIATVAHPVLGAEFDGPVLGPRVDLDAQLALARSSGVQSIRLQINWAASEPRRGELSLAATDRVVRAAARHGISVLPVVVFTPAWAGSGAPNAPPRDPGDYGRFLTALIRRYGPSGSLWRANPGAGTDPIRMWQIWNEPDFTRYWAPQPFAPSYVRLLAAAHSAIKAADPGAQVVSAGLPEFSWQYLAQILAQPGAAGDFDLAGVHPYTAQPAGVLTILRRDRAALDAHGAAAKPLLATEITWPSSSGHAPPQFGVGVSEPDQAQRIDAVMPLLTAARARLRLAGVYWYTWMGDETPTAHPYAFNYAGLVAYRSGSVLTKPALAAFRAWARAFAAAGG